MSDGQRRLGALLVESGVIDEAALERALEAQRSSGRRLGRVLVANGVLAESALIDALSRQLGLERWIPGERPSRASARALVPKASAVAARCVPLARSESSTGIALVLATSDPLAPAAGRLVRTLADEGVTVRWLLASEDEIEEALATRYAPERARPTPASVLVVKGRPERPPMGETEAPPLAEEASSVPIAPLVSGKPLSSTRAVPALGVATARVTGHTLLADDAVLEIVDEEVEGPELALEAPSLHGPKGSSTHEAGREDRAWARAARSAYTNWGELVPELPPPTDSRSSAAETSEAPGPVALARLAIRRADGGIREVVPSSLQNRDPGEERAFRAGGASSEVSLDVLTPVPHVEPEARSEDEAAPARASSEIEPTETVDAVPSGEGTSSESTSGESTSGESTSAESSTDDVFGREPTLTTGEIPGLASAAASVESTGEPALIELEEADVEPLGPEDDPSWSGPSTRTEAETEVAAPDDEEAGHERVSDLELEPSESARSEGPRDAPAPSPDAPAPVAEAVAEEASAPSEAGTGPSEADELLADRAAELHARLIRFAGGEPLPEAQREAALRVVVSALLRRGDLDETFVLEVLRRQ